MTTTTFFFCFVTGGAKYVYFISESTHAMYLTIVHNYY